MHMSVGSTYQGKKIRLDGNTFVNCKFIECIIEYGGETPTQLDSCNFENCQWILVGKAENTLNFLGSIYHGLGDFGKKMVEATFENIKKPPVATEKDHEKEAKS